MKNQMKNQMKTPMNIVDEKSVRVDLLGGTIDIWPLNIIIPDVITINLATSLKVRVEIEETDFDGIEIDSKDYNSCTKIPSSDLTKENIYIQRKFAALTFIIQLLDYFKLNKNLKITTASSIPAGSGLGGSSALGIALFSSLCKYTNKSKQNKQHDIKIVQDIEANALDMGPTGYQDYYPALYGGILGLKSSPGNIDVEQLYTPELKQYLEENISLIYSGETRYSALNNWEVFKKFFDKDSSANSSVRKQLHQISAHSYEGYQAIKDKDYEKLKDSIIKEGEVRKELCPTIVTKQMSSLLSELKKQSQKSNKEIGIKVCGAGGGGCFLLVHKKNDLPLIMDKIKEFSMKAMEFKIMNPLL
ncbi:MAG: hypothetical protein HQK49_04135 [Oligoflexia bacterium]|nr:hypothetical protein [Oligoflexia bacterium]